MAACCFRAAAKRVSFRVFAFRPRPRMTALDSHVPAFAGFWRRVGAFLVDGFLLGLVGWGIGALFYDQLVHLGPWGRAIGFMLTLAYFVPQESRHGGGQSVGKRMLGIRVVDASGLPLDTRRTLLRFVVFGVPYFLNGAALPMGVSTFLGGLPLAVLAFGGMLALAYLLVFNRRTRQSLHDLATGAFVVRVAGIPGEQASDVPATRMWRGHRVVVITLFVLCALTPLAVPQLMRLPMFAGLQAVYAQVAAQPEVRAVNVFEITTARAGLQGTSSQRALLVQATIETRVADALPLATRLAGLALAAYPGAANDDVIAVRLARGFDLGIASSWTTNEIAFTPAQWRDRVQGGADN